MSGSKSSPKPLGDFFSRPDERRELYTSDQKTRRLRADKGYITKGGGAFDFIYLIRNWDQIVGRLMSQNTIPHKIVRSTLIVMTKHNVFAHELSFMAPQILAKIEEKVPELRGKISKIKFSHANYSWDDFQHSAQRKAPQENMSKLHPYSPQYQVKKNRARELFGDIEDQEVQEALIAFYINS